MGSFKSFGSGMQTPCRPGRFGRRHSPFTVTTVTSELGGLVARLVKTTVPRPTSSPSKGSSGEGGASGDAVNTESSSGPRSMTEAIALRERSGQLGAAGKETAL